MVNLLATRIIRFFSAYLPSSQLAPSLYWCMGLFLPRCRTLHLSLLNHVMGACQPISPVIWISAIPPRFELSANLLRLHSAPFSRSSNGLLNATSAKISPWGTPLVDDFQLDSISPMITLWVQQFSPFYNHLTVHLIIPCLINLSKRKLWETVSKALLKSRQHPLLSPHPPSQSSHWGRLSGQSGIISPS